MRRYEDLKIGEKAVSEPIEVDRDDMIAFARKYDPQWFHADPAAAEQSVFGEVVASGIYTAALWRKLDDHADWISVWDHFYEAPPKNGTEPHFEALTTLGASPYGRRLSRALERWSQGVM